MNEIRHSKNVVTAHIDAEGNVIVGDGNNITVINLKEAAQYKAIEAEIQELNERFEKARQKSIQYPDDPDFAVDLINIDSKRSERQKELETLKQEVIKLAEDFARIPINTERLKKAKAHFENGEFAEARAVLDAEQMGVDLNTAIQREELGKALQEQAQEDRKNLANEYLILARLTATDFELPDRFEKTVEYFEQSVRAVRNEEIIFEFANFLQKHNRITEAIIFYEEALEIYQTLVEINSLIYLPYVADTLNNLGLLHSDKIEFEEAQSKLDKALNIYLALEKSDPEKFSPDVAKTRNNLGVLYRRKKDLEKAQSEFEKALAIYQSLIQSESQNFKTYLAGTLNNLANLHLDKKELDKAQVEFEEALRIYQALAQINSQEFLPYVAHIQNNLANLYREKNELKSALKEGEEALGNYRSLAQTNPQAFLPYVANTASNMAVFYQDNISNQEKSLEFVKEALRAAAPFMGYLELAKDSIRRAMTVIRKWGLDFDEFFKGNLN